MSDDFENPEELKKIIGDFDKEHTIEKIILLGLDGSIRRIDLDILEEDE